MKITSFMDNRNYHVYVSMLVLKNFKLRGGPQYIYTALV